MREQLLLKEHAILKSGTRILRPPEYKEIRNRAKTDKAFLMDCLLLTGLRYEEMLRVRQHPEWFDGNFIHLPQWAQKKAMRKQKERWVKLSIMGRSILPRLWEITVPPRTTFDKWLRYNFPMIGGLSAKTFRKTLESWLLSRYPERSIEISLSQGHDQLTELRYYANLPFLEKDKQEMKEYIEGWI